MIRRASTPFVIGALAVLCSSTLLHAQHSSGALRPVPPARTEAVPHPSVVHHAGAPSLRGSAPENDECANATPVTLVDPADCASSVIHGTTAGAVPVQGDPACDQSTAGYADVWYAFNSGTHGEVLIDLHPGPDIGHWAFSLQTSCDPASEVACFIYPNGPIPITVTPNTDYLVRCYTNLDNGGGGAFDLCLAYQPYFEPPVNDLCSAPTPVNVVDINDCGTLSTPGTTLGAAIVHDAPSCDGSNVGFADVWYTFNSGPHTELYITLTRDADVVDLGFTLQSSCDPADEVVCFVNPWGTVLANVQPNTDYLMRCFNNLRYGARGDFSVCVAALPDVPPPANDHCADVVPEALAVGSTLTFTGDVSGATEAGDFEPNSQFEGEEAVWHAFTTAECANVVVSYCGTATTFNNVYLVLSGNCPMSDDVIYSTNWGSTCDNGNANILFMQLPAGTYYLPVMRDYVLGSYGPYSITVAATSCTALPVNDRCSDVTPVDIPVGTSHLFEGDLSNATSTGDFDPNSIWAGSNAAVWHAFTISECADVTLDYCGSPFPLGIVYYHLVAACPAVSDSLAGDVDFFSCPTGNAIIRFHGVPAGTYYIPVMSDPANNATGPYALNVITTPCPLPPVNDECTGAIALIPSDTCAVVDGTALGATQSLPPTACGFATSPNAMDVWYSFLANSTHERITVFGHQQFDAIMQLFDGTCGALDSIDCADETFVIFNPVNEVIERGDFVVGHTYYLRVYDFAAYSLDQTFGICVESMDATGIAEHPAQGAFGVYPNPNSGSFTVNYAGAAGLGALELFDVTGRRIWSTQQVLRTGQQVPLELEGRLTAGTYVLRLTVNGSRSEQRLVVH